VIGKFVKIQDKGGHGWLKTRIKKSKLSVAYNI